MDHSDRRGAEKRLGSLGPQFFEATTQYQEELEKQGRTKAGVTTWTMLSEKIFEQVTASAGR
jgi:hypothetical protein